MLPGPGPNALSIESRYPPRKNAKGEGIAGKPDGRDQAASEDIQKQSTMTERPNGLRVCNN